MQGPETCDFPPRVEHQEGKPRTLAQRARGAMMPGVEPEHLAVETNLSLEIGGLDVDPSDVRIGQGIPGRQPLRGRDCPVDPFRGSDHRRFADFTGLDVFRYGSATLPNGINRLPECSDLNAGPYRLVCAE